MSYKRIQMYFFLGLLLGAALLTALLFYPYLGSLVLGVTFAIVFRPLHRKIFRAFGGRAVLAALLSTVILVVIVLVPLIFFGVELFNEASGLLSLIANGGNGFSHSFAEAVQDRLGGFVDLSTSDLTLYINQYVGELLRWLVGHLGAVFSGVAKVFFTLFLGLFAFYYFLKDGSKLRDVLMAVSPLADEYDKEVFGKLSSVVNSVIKGSLVVAIFQGILAGVGFWIFGVPNPVLWGAVGMLAALIPMLGTAIVTLPGVLYLALIGNIIPALGLLIWSLLLVGTVDNFIRPKLIERGSDIHPFLILLSVLGGVNMFGPIGLIIGPLILSLLFALLHIYQVEFKEYSERV